MGAHSADHKPNVHFLYVFSSITVIIYIFISFFPFLDIRVPSPVDHMWIYHKLNLQDCATHADCLITFHYPTALPVAILSIVFVVLDLADFDSL